MKSKKIEKTITEVITPEENIIELPSNVIDYLKNEVSKFNEQIKVELDKPDYQNLLAQKKATLDRFTSIKQALHVAENDYLKIESSLSLMENQINSAKASASKLQIGTLRGLVIANGVDGNLLGTVEIIEKEGKMYVKYQLKE